ncbi:30253_t:CDS:2, partial [Gigaspora margarita]
TFIDITTNYHDSDYIKDRAILTTKNVDVEDINQQILKKISNTEEFEYFFADLVEDKAQVDQSLYLTEFLNTLTPSRMLSYHLILKKDVSVILLCNLDPSERICNADSDFPFQFERRQFPIRLSFAITINKAQDQIILIMELYLPKPVFSYGQLYVALSKVQLKDNIKVIVKDGHIKGKKDVYTRNIVYKEVFY